MEWRRAILPLATFLVFHASMASGQVEYGYAVPDSVQQMMDAYRGVRDLYIRRGIGPIYYQFPQGENIVIVRGDTVYTAQGAFCTMMLLTLIQEWDAYLAECKADTHTVSGHQYAPYQGAPYRIRDDPSYPMVDPGFNSGYQGPVTWTEHREPTVEGFMEFIRKRVARGEKRGVGTGIDQEE